MATRAAPAPRRDAAYIRAVAEELQYLQAWEAGLVPWPASIVRIRQIRRAAAGPPGWEQLIASSQVKDSKSRGSAP